MVSLNTLATLHTYPMKKNERNTEMNIIKHILQQNRYQVNNPLKHKSNKGNTTLQYNKQQGKWAALTYFGKEIRKVATIFKDSNIKIAYISINTI